MFRHKNQTEDFLFSISKICETFIKQSHGKPQETLVFKLTKTRKLFI